MKVEVKKSNVIEYGHALIVAPIKHEHIESITAVCLSEVRENLDLLKVEGTLRNVIMIQSTLLFNEGCRLLSVVLSENMGNGITVIY